MFLSWDSSHVFLMLRLRSLVWGRKAAELKCHFDHIIKRVHTVNGTVTTKLVSLGHLADAVFHGFLTVKLPPPHPLSILSSRRKSARRKSRRASRPSRFF